MSGRVRLALAAMGALLVVVMGCQRAYPEPSAEAILDFLRNARLHGRLRVCWPAGQAYVEKVMQADAALHKALRVCAPIQTVDELWSRDDPRWRTECPANPTSASGDVAHSAVTAALDALSAAIAAVPADLPVAGSDNAGAFADRVWEALAIDGLPLREYVEQLEALGRLQARLNARVAECAGSFDTNAGGLAFTDQGCQRDVDVMYEELAAALRAREERFLEFAAKQMSEVHARVGKIDKQKERDKYLLLDNTREYFDNLLRDGWLKRLDDRIRAANQRLAAHRSGKEKLPPGEAKFLEHEVERLKQRYEALARRVDAVLKAPGG